MFEMWTVVTVQSGGEGPEDLKKTYGEQAVITRVYGYNLVHLDDPSQETLKRRIDEFDPELLFDDDCPICRSLREQRVDVIFLGDRPGGKEFN